MTLGTAPDPASLRRKAATVIVQQLSDRLWTEATGHRTPANLFGTFWDDEEDAGDDDLLEGLEPEAEPGAEAAPVTN